MGQLFRLFTVCLILPLTCCDRPQEPDKESPPEVAQPTDEFELTPALKSEVEAFGRRFEAAVFERNEDYLLSVIDFRTMVYSGLHDQDLPSEVKRGIEIGIVQAKQNALQNLYVGELKFIEVAEFKGNPSAIFRLRIENGGFEYLQYAITKNEDDTEWRVIEAFPFSVGMEVSELMRSMLLPLIEQENKSLFQKLTTDSSLEMDWLMTLPKVQQVMRLSRENQGEAALKVFDEIEDRFKSKRISMLVHIMAAGATDDLERYGQALSAFEAKFPNDPSLLMQSIDANFLQNDFEAARESIAKLKDVVNDSYLDFYAGFVFLAEENYEEAGKLAKQWLRDNPNDFEGLNLQLEVAVATDKHRLTHEAIKALEAHHQLDFYESVQTDLLFEPFKMSEVGDEYLTERTGN